MKLFLTFLFTLALVISGCQSKPSEISAETVKVDGGSYTNVNAEELNTMLKKKDFVLVNVHIPFEGNIMGTDMSLPYNQISEPTNLSQLPSKKDAKIVLYCRSGRMSEIATQSLIELGYSNIWNLDGGMVAWEQAGYPLQDQ
jgi:rhodanese-related sulfurtransferase